MSALCRGGQKNTMWTLVHSLTTLRSIAEGVRMLGLAASIHSGAVVLCLTSLQLPGPLPIRVSFVTNVRGNL